MRYYFAPMEGLTDEIYRRTHHQYFPGVHSYYMPFLSPTVHRTLTPREARELPYADAVSFRAVPQILTKVTDDFLWAAQQCLERGYDEVNLNLGCPSGTVTAKGKGSGMLRDPDGLDAFLEGIFSASPLPVSVKTRIGFTNPEEFPRLLDIFNRYPIKELTVHPRVRSVFYNGAVDMEAFRYAVRHSKAPLCYNGNLCSPAQIRALEQEFPQLQAVMLGRALVADPGMLCPDGTSPAVLEQFMEDMLQQYIVTFHGSRNAMFRLKENWHYLICHFDNAEKLYKQLRKSTDVDEYRSLVKCIFRTLPMRKEPIPNW